MDSTTPFLPLDLPADMAVMVDLTTLAAVLATVPDLRHRRGIRYPLVPLILIALLAKLSGATRLCALAEWAQLRAAPLARLFGLSRTTMPHYTTWSSHLWCGPGPHHVCARRPARAAPAHCDRRAAAARRDRARR